MNILRKLLGLKEKAQIRVVLVYRNAYAATVEEWRSDAKACQDAKQLLANPLLRNMLDVLRNNQLGMYYIDREVPPEQRVAFADYAAGYTKALNDLEDLARYQPMIAEIEATFAKENAEQLL
jgi:hypothetical protein